MRQLIGWYGVGPESCLFGDNGGDTVRQLVGSYDGDREVTCLASMAGDG
ncbi:hypothetical protein [Paenibacillus ferrarius]